MFPKAQVSGGVGPRSRRKCSQGPRCRPQRNLSNFRYNWKRFELNWKMEVSRKFEQTIPLSYKIGTICGETKKTDQFDHVESMPAQPRRFQ